MSKTESTPSIVTARYDSPPFRLLSSRQGVLSSAQIFGLVEACREDGRQSRRFAVPLQLLSGGEDPAHPSLEVSLTVDTTPSAPGSRTELGSSNSSSTGLTVRPANQLPTWTDVIAGRTNQPPAREVAAVADTAERFAADPSSETEIRQAAREAPVSRRHTWVCGDAERDRGWAEHPGRSPVPITREEGSQTELDSQEAPSRSADSPPVSQAADPRIGDSRAADLPTVNPQPNGVSSSSSEESLSQPNRDDRTEEADSQPSSEAEMLRRLRRPLAAPPAVAVSERANVLSDIERDLERLRRTGSIFSGQRRGAGGHVDDTTQTEELPGGAAATAAAATAAAVTVAATTPVQPSAWTRAVPAGLGAAEGDAAAPMERGGAGDAARRRSWSAAAETGEGECAPGSGDVPLLEPRGLSVAREQQVLHVRTDSGAGEMAQRARLLSETTGRRGDGSALSSEAATPATRIASSLENVPTTNGRPAVSIPHHSQTAPPRRDPSSFTTRPPATSLPPTAASSVPPPESCAESWVSAVTPGTRPVSSLAGPASPVSSPEPSTATRDGDGDGDGDGAFRAQLTVVEALHLPRIVRGERREQPRVLVSVQTAAGLVASPLEVGTRPRWNWSQLIWVGRELLQQVRTERGSLVGLRVGDVGTRKQEWV